MGIVGSLNLKGACRAEAGASACDVDLHVTRYHMAQAKTARRREKSRADAPKRALARRSALDAAFEAAEAIRDAEERKAALLKLDEKAASAKRSADIAKSERDMVRRRMRVGFENAVHVEVGGRMRAPFREQGLRSDRLGNAAKLFVRGCRKGAKLRAANEKGFIQKQFRRKVLTLDYAWVEGNREMVSLFRVDLDRLFESFDHLRELLREMVDAGRLPCMPHLVAGDVTVVSTLTADNDILTRPMLVRPHLWFVLPDAVNMGPKGREGPKRLLDAVYRGLCHVLLPLGADPNAKALLVRGKSPLSPWWQSQNLNDESFPSLAGYARALGPAMKASQEQLARMAAEQQSGLTKTASNEFFNAASTEAWRILREWQGRGDRAYLAALSDREALGSLLAAAMPMDRVLLLGDGLVEPRRGAYVLDKVVGYAASRWDPAKADSATAFRGRGKLRHLTDGKATVREKQAVAGRATAEAKQDAARKRILGGMYSVTKAGSDFTQSEVARVSGVSRKTVGKHWRFCLRAWVNRCVDKKGGLTPGPSSHGTTVGGDEHERTEALAMVVNPDSKEDTTVVQEVAKTEAAPVVRTDSSPSWSWSPGCVDDSDESDLQALEDRDQFLAAQDGQGDGWYDPEGLEGLAAWTAPDWTERPTVPAAHRALSLSNPAPMLT